MSDHSLRVFQLASVTPWPLSDQLDQVEAGGWLCAVRRGEFKPGDLVVFVEPDFVVPTSEPEFAFLAMDRAGKPRENPPARYRITARKLRGTWSQGLIIRARAGWKVGQDVRELLGVERWAPPEPKTQRFPKGTIMRKKNSPKGLQVPYYDVEAGRKFSKVWREFLDVCRGDIVVTEKIHGANMSVVFHDGELYVRSRTVWKAKPKERFWAKVVRWLKQKPRAPITGCWWWAAVDQQPWIESFCRQNPGLVLFGEVFGPQVQGETFGYGLKPHEFGFRAFDVFDPTTKAFWPFQKVVEALWSGARFVPYRRIAWAPGVFPEPVNPTGPSEVGGGIFREGVVYRGWSADYTSPGAGLPLGERIVLKDVCPQFLAGQEQLR